MKKLFNFKGKSIIGKKKISQLKDSNEIILPTYDDLLDVTRYVSVDYVKKPSNQVQQIVDFDNKLRIQLNDSVNYTYFLIDALEKYYDELNTLANLSRLIARYFDALKNESKMTDKAVGLMLECGPFESAEDFDKIFIKY